MNVFQIVKDAFAQFTDNEVKPLHVGEVMNLWFLLVASEQNMRVEQVSYNICQDKDLKKKINELIHDVHGPMVKELQDFFKKEGIPNPNMTPEKVIGDYRTVPDGAKMSDEEIANIIAYNLVIGITAAVRGLTESVRTDVGYKFLKFQMTKVAFSVSYKKMMEEKGWINVPPYYNQELHIK
ncbi:hypothetical protein C0966_11355 [Bacillus methanolicus]|uniref:DUF3231 family protein n=1 Tax=Bacillus methanolicus TaxID=1471 RepID=UPI00238038AC|nr:DUF3231 family protein [Bacillus methanolicus]MDE3839956.1 hypothetical protein [Bacillus methanolicus]